MLTIQNKKITSKKLSSKLSYLISQFIISFCCFVINVQCPVSAYRVRHVAFVDEV
jgi:hypothetical protein